MDKLEKLLENPFQQSVYLFASTEQEPLREAAEKVLHALQKQQDDADFTRLDGPAPDIGEVIAAAGTISFFGTPRIVQLREISTATMADKDVAELAQLFAQLENAVLLVTVHHKDKKAAGTKKAKQLFGAAAEAGFAAELAKPGRKENLDFLARTAAGLGASFAPGAAQALLEAAGENRPLLAAETQKLAAMCGYGEISLRSVERYATHNIEADVFQLLRFITAGRKGQAFEKLEELFSLKHEPIAIAAALAGSYVDMYRVRCGAEKGLSVATVFKQMNYKGNEYRLQKAKENAARYSTAQLEECILCLYQLDRQLKSSALPDKGILLQAAMATLMRTGAR